MSPRPSRASRDLLSLYKHARIGEHNIGGFLREHPELAARLGRLDLERDDAELALQLAPAVGHYKRSAARVHASERASRAEEAARLISARARHRDGRVELAPDLLLGALLVDSSRRYVAFNLVETRVLVSRQVLSRARSALLGFPDLSAYVDDRGLHFVWRGGRGGLNLLPQAQEVGAAVLEIDLSPPPSRRELNRPLRLGEVLAELGLL